MKHLLILSVLLSASFVEASCIDYRAAMIAPCPDGTESVFITGSCAKPKKADRFCAQKEPSCSDRTLIDLAPCPEGEVTAFYKGRCKKKNHFEHFYCDVVR